MQDKQQAAAQVCNAAHTLHHSAVTRALQLEAVVQEQQLQLDEADRRHQLFVKRARFVSLAGGTSRSDACYACSAAHADAMEEAAAQHALQLQAKDKACKRWVPHSCMRWLCNARLWQLLCEVESQKLRVKELEQQQAANDMARQHADQESALRVKAAEQQLSETRSSVEEQQQQLVAAVDLQGRTHARLMQLTAEHNQVT